MMLARMLADLPAIPPDPNGLPGTTQLQNLVGGIMFYGLLIALLAAIGSAAIWGFGGRQQHAGMAVLGRTAFLWSLVGAAVIGAGVPLINSFLHIGMHVTATP